MVDLQSLTVLSFIQQILIEDLKYSRHFWGYGSKQSKWLFLLKDEVQGLNFLCTRQWIIQTAPGVLAFPSYRPFATCRQAPFKQLGLKSTTLPYLDTSFHFLLTLWTSPLLYPTRSLMLGEEHSDASSRSSDNLIRRKESYLMSWNQCSPYVPLRCILLLWPFMKRPSLCSPVLEVIPFRTHLWGICPRSHFCQRLAPAEIACLLHI